ncbi:MAG: hypothetical protein AAFX80_16670 [Cyanobacteria bacterium J06639_18]
MFAETRFISASVIVLLLGVQLVTPKISQAIANFTNVTFDSPKAIASHGTVKISDSHNFKPKNKIDEEFQPPDYGGPDSERGSGTR